MAGVRPGIGMCWGLPRGLHFHFPQQPALLQNQIGKAYIGIILCNAGVITDSIFGSNIGCGAATFQLHGAGTFQQPSRLQWLQLLALQCPAGHLPA